MINDHIKTTGEIFAEEFGTPVGKKDNNINYKPSKKKAEKDNAVYTSFLETPDFILEQVVNTTHTTHTTNTTDTYFVLYDKKTCLVENKYIIVYQGVEYKPIIDELLEKKTILLPSGVEEYGDEKQLTDRIKKFLFSYFELPPFFEKLLPYLILFYWVYDKFPFVPYLHFVGLTGTGKTTAQEVFGSICYKPIDASGAITLSPIFRTASTWHGTLLLDEFEPNGEGYDEMLAFLKSGVGNKAVLRTEGDAKREVRVYMIKSPKVFTSEHPIANAGLQSRTLVVEMHKNTRRIPLYRLGGFLEEAEHLRNQLLMWRLRNINKVNLKDIEYGFPELQGFDRRVQQVITPVYYLSDEKTKLEIAQFAEVQEKETKRERAESLEGQIFQVIVDNFPANVSLAIVHNEINKDIRGRREISQRKIASIVRRIFGFEIERLGDQNISTVIVENKEEKIKELVEYFGSYVSVGNVVRVVSVVNEPGSKFEQEMLEVVEED